MKTFELRILISGLLYILAIISGIWLSRKGEPYNTALINIHKLLSLISLVIIAIVFTKLRKYAELNSLEMFLLIITGLFCILSIVSGALLSMDQSFPKIVLNIHKYVPILLTISLIITIYILVKDIYKHI